MGVRFFGLGRVVRNSNDFQLLKYKALKKIINTISSRPMVCFMKISASEFLAFFFPSPNNWDLFTTNMSIVKMITVDKIWDTAAI